MSSSPLAAVEAWINGNLALRGVKGNPGPLSLGAFADSQNPPRSPATGVFCLLTRTQSAIRNPVAEDSSISWSRIDHMIFGAEAAVADLAAMTLADQLYELPPDTPMGLMVCKATANITGPSSMPVGIDQWDYCLQVGADYLLYDGG